jgi:hypothetical protein
MPHFWLTYGDTSRLIGVVIIEAPSLFEARLDAALARLDGGMSYTDGVELGADLVTMLPPAQIGRLISGEEAEALVRRFEGRKLPPRRKPKSKKQSG